MKLVYIYLNKVKKESANMNQTLNMVSSLSKLIKTDLILGYNSKKNIKNIEKFIGIKRNYNLIRVPIKLITNYLFFEKISRIIFCFFALSYIKLKKYDTIYTRDFGFIYFLSFLPKFLRPKQKIFFENHTIYHLTSNKVNFNQEKKAYKIVDNFVATTKNCKNDLINYFKISKKNILVSSNGVNFSFFKKENNKKILNKFGIKKHNSYLIYSGSFLWWKGIDTLIKAMHLIKDKTVKLLLVGGYGKDLDYIKKLIEKEKLYNKIIITGYLKQNEMISLLKFGKIGIIPNNKSEEGTKYTSPLKLFEYMACGLPIVCSDLPSMKEILNENKNCLFFEPENEKDLAEKINSLLNDKKLQDKMKLNNLKDVNHYSWDERARRVNKFLNKTK